uniref:Uncharacterized protein n=1 Tax=Rhizophora mucronata TaxID=61149 RepID=A0A2P2PJJ3_RHIMU
MMFYHSSYKNFSVPQT